MFGRLLIPVLAILVGCNPQGPGQTQPAPVNLGDGFVAIGDEVGVDGLPTRVQHEATGIVLILIAPGKFMIGTPDSEARRDWDEVYREVEVAQAFYLGETEVTVAQWQQAMEPDAAAPGPSSELPANDITWYDAMEFVDRLNQGGETGWRLPTEVEWEFAARAGTTTPFFHGETVTPDQANYDGHYPYPTGPRAHRSEGVLPVRSFAPNAWGLYDMHGNVAEWCSDIYVGRPDEDIPSDEKGVPRVVRGGSWISGGEQLRSGYRDGYAPATDGPEYGFRVAWSGPR